jgi:NAD(P)-dependent dehydrogenase (short-subunit alcohol dehydrogenase family)
MGESLLRLKVQLMDPGAVALVTGASQGKGTGREVAQQFVCQDRTVGMVARNILPLAEAAQYIESTGPTANVIPMPADLSGMAGVHRVADDVHRRFPKVNVLV